jgi:hypothetical protein
MTFYHYILIFLAVCLACYIGVRTAAFLGNSRRLERMRAAADDKHQRHPLPMRGSKQPSADDVLDEVNEMLEARQEQAESIQVAAVSAAWIEGLQEAANRAQKREREAAAIKPQPRQIPRGAHGYPDLQ